MHQLWYCFWRVWAQYWRTPSYLYAKTALCTISSIFVSNYGRCLSLNGLS